jgi:hypothetical protein
MLYPNETLIKQAQGAFGKPYYLAHVTTGTEIAGSGTREVKECYRVIYKFDGNRHSKAFNTQEEALAEFNRWTQPIIEQRGL